jgi:uncharacterized membrane protein
MLTGTLDSLIAAAAAFVAGHFILSSRGPRRALVRALGEQQFLLVYSVIALASFVWMLAAYGEAPYLAIWAPPPVLRWVPLLVMPVVCFLVVNGLTTRSLTTVGGGSAEAAGGPRSAAPGIISITRHPALWGFALWALAHLAVRGDAANMILMLAIVILSIGGMVHIDQRREEALGSAWGPTKMTTSLIPFAAVLSGRTALDWRGIGWYRTVAALALFVVLLYAHPWIAGIAVVPH